MRKSFDIALVINDEARRYQLTPSFQAISEIEGHEVHRGDNGSLLLILDRFSRQQQRVTDYVAIIHGCLRAAGETDVTAEEVGEALTDTGLAQFAIPCIAILYEALGVTKGGKFNAKKKKTSGKKKAGKKSGKK